MDNSTTTEKNHFSLEQIQNFNGKYPKQLWYLALVEMWERFCFYGMRGMLTVFMIDELFFTKQNANLKYGAIQAFVYAFTFIGGIFADKILGFRKSLVFGALLMILGNILVASSPHNLFFLGITLTVIGTGFFKPNISSMVGYLYKEGDHRKDAGFGLFYTAINVGALIGGSICVVLGKSHSWALAFLSAAFVMLIGLIVFICTKRYLGPIGTSPLKNISVKKRNTYEILVYIGAIATIPLIFLMLNNTRYTDLFMYTIGPLALLYFLFQFYKIKELKDRKKLIAALLLILFSILFFALFEQAGGSLAIFAKDNLRPLNLYLFKIDPNAVNNGANSLFVILFSTPLGLLWYWLSKRKKEPNTVVKFGLGFLFVALSFYTFYSTIFFVDSNGITSINIFVLAYLFMTIGELCLSPIGLSMITSLSPKHLSGMMMGMWFLASAYGQYVAGLLGADISNPDNNATRLESLISYTNGYHTLAIYSLIFGIVIIIVSPVIRKLMQGVK